MWGTTATTAIIYQRRRLLARSVAAGRACTFPQTVVEVWCVDFSGDGGVGGGQRSSTPACISPAQYLLSRPSCNPIKSKGFDVNPSWASHTNTSLTMNALNLRDCQRHLKLSAELQMFKLPSIITDYQLSAWSIDHYFVDNPQIFSLLSQRRQKHWDFEPFHLNRWIIRAVRD